MSLRLQHGRRDGAGGEVGEERNAGHCRAMSSHGLGPISRESIERRYVNECCDLFLFFNHYSRILCARCCAVSIHTVSHQILLQSRKLNIGDIMWLPKVAHLWLAGARIQTQVGLTPERLLWTSTLRCSTAKQKLSRCLQTTLIQVLMI